MKYEKDCRAIENHVLEASCKFPLETAEDWLQAQNQLFNISSGESCTGGGVSPMYDCMWQSTKETISAEGDGRKRHRHKLLSLTEKRKELLLSQANDRREFLVGYMARAYEISVLRQLAYEIASNIEHKQNYCALLKLFHQIAKGGSVAHRFSLEGCQKVDKRMLAAKETLSKYLAAVTEITTFELLYPKRSETLREFCCEFWKQDFSPLSQPESGNEGSIKSVSSVASWGVTVRLSWRPPSVSISFSSHESNAPAMTDVTGSNNLPTASSVEFPSIA
jgi:hypothetical protein